MYAHFKNSRFFAFFGGTVDKPTAATHGVHHDFINLSEEQLTQLRTFDSRRDATALLMDDRSIRIVDVLSANAINHARLLDAREVSNVFTPSTAPMKNTATTIATTARPLSTIAREIQSIWSKQSKGVYFGAVPYLNAMSTLSTIDDTYGCDDAETIVLYFLANATSFRGPDAVRLKKELKTIAKIK